MSRRQTRFRKLRRAVNRRYYERNREAIKIIKGLDVPMATARQMLGAAR